MLDLSQIFLKESGAILHLASSTTFNTQLKDWGVVVVFFLLLEGKWIFSYGLVCAKLCLPQRPSPRPGKPAQPQRPGSRPGKPAQDSAPLSAPELSTVSCTQESACVAQP